MSVSIMGKDPEKVTKRNVSMKRKYWAQLEFIYMKEGFSDPGEFIAHLLEDGRM